MHSFFLFAAISSAALAKPNTVAEYIRAASNTPSETQTQTDSAGNGTTTAEPCAQVSSFLAANTATLVPQIPADLALQCLKSVPLNAVNDALQLEGVMSFANFQSTLAYLKDPPSDWPYPAVDILGGMQQIQDQLHNGHYTTEYDFQTDIRKLVTSAHDAHFVYLPDITMVLNFQRENNLFSVSKDGHALPEIYLDIDLLLPGDNVTGTVSPIVQINGEDVQSFLNNLAGTLPGRDRDANYNSLFPFINTPKATPWPTTSYFHTTFDYPGTDTVVEFKNGSTRHIATFATTTADFSGVIDGKSFFEKFCNATAQATNSSSTSSSSSAVPTSTQVPYAPVATPTPIAAPFGFPEPELLASDYSIGCYFPAAHGDLTVLTIPTFEPTDTTEFEDVARKCLATSHARGKRRLVLDVRGNGGGDLYLGHDLFKQLFPGIEPWGAGNFRAWPLFNDLGKVISQHYQYSTVNNVTASEANLNFGPPFNFREELTSSLAHFASWQQFFGPVPVHGDDFTNLMRTNLSDLWQTGAIGVDGYGALAGSVPVQTFAAQDIVLLTDGFCGSACAVFAEFLKTQASVPQIVIGGRAQYGPMQAIGGTKGSLLEFFVDFATIISDAFLVDANSTQQTHLQKTYGTLEIPWRLAAARAAPPASMAVNWRNNIRQGDKTLTPLQFVYEAAACRLFYTAPMISKQQLVWSAAYEVRWANNRMCVDGSTGQPSSMSWANGTVGWNASGTPTGSADPMQATGNAAAEGLRVRRRVTAAFTVGLAAMVGLVL